MPLMWSAKRSAMLKIRSGIPVVGNLGMLKVSQQLKSAATIFPLSVMILLSSCQKAPREIAMIPRATSTTIS
jgi:hypothetical protein